MALPHVHYLIFQTHQHLGLLYPNQADLWDSRYLSTGALRLKNASEKNPSKNRLDVKLFVYLSVCCLAAVLNQQGTNVDP